MAGTPTPLPRLVLLPGMDGTGDLFQPLIEAFGDRVRVQVLWYPVDQPLGYDGLEALVRPQLPAGERFVLLGESFSGPLAVSIGARAPAGLAGVVLCCTFVRNPRPGLAWMAPLAPWVPFDRLPTAPAVSALLGRDGTPALRRALDAAIRRVSGEVMRARLRAVLAVDAAEALAAVTVPAFSLRASEDHVVPAAASVALQHGQNVTEQFLGGPHCLLQAAPAESAAVLLNFLRTLPSER